MDFVRLGLERGRSAREAKEVITGLLEQYGQGGIAVRGTDRRYHNSYIIADPKEAWVLETSGRHWVAKRITTGAAISNVVTIEDDWDDASVGIQQHARDRGWWLGSPNQKLNFRDAFEDAELRNLTEPRYLASCAFLERSQSITAPAMKRHLRDHFDGGAVNVVYPGRPRTICVHPAEYLSSTAASLVVELRPGANEPIVAWCSMATPCTGVFLPVVLGTPLPEPMGAGTESQMDGSLWWTMRHLQRLVDRNPVELTPIVQRQWSEWEAELESNVDREPEALRGQLSSLVAELMHRTDQLIGDLHETRVASREPRVAAGDGRGLLS
jgi:secernin